MHTKNPFISIYGLLILFIFAMIPFHAPLVVMGSVLLPDFELLIKAWKEILLVATSLVAIITITKHRLWHSLLHDRLLLLIGIYALLHLLLLSVFQLGVEQTVVGLMVDLRYLLFFVLVYILVLTAPRYGHRALRISVVSASVVLLFSLLQITVLPVDVLADIGYSSNTIEPYLTIDKNPDYVRINGTLRGPNPLGAYALICMSLTAAYLLSTTAIKKKSKLYLVSLGTVLVTSVAVIWASYSRSALIAAIGSALLVVLLSKQKLLLSKKWAAIVLIPLLVVCGLLFSIRNSDFVQNVIVHNDPTDSVLDNSNEGHVDSLVDGTNRMIAQPLGAGPGSTGSASLFSSKPLIIENQYLFIAHETGWLGLLLFMSIMLIVLYRLYRAKSWLNNGLLASGIGLSMIGLLLPVWVDDTVSMVWWGLAAVALALQTHKSGTNYGTISTKKQHEQK